MNEATVVMSRLYEDENWLEFCARRGVPVFDFRSLEGTCGYCSEESALLLERGLKDAAEARIRWIDGGDYHYLSYILMKHIAHPFELLLLDNHPDDQSAPLLSCGSWVLEARRNLGNLMPSGSGPDIPLYISIDLDVLSSDCARTNWNQGEMSLEALCGALRTAVEGRTVEYVDICGGISRAQGARDEDLETNYRLRLEMLEFINKSII